MTGRGRHAAVALIAIALLVALAAARVAWHAPLGIAVVALAAAFDPPVARALGRPWRWIATGAVLALVGLWLAPADARVAGRAVSLAGALAATTMLARAAAIVLLGAAVTAIAPPTELLGRLRGRRGGGFVEVLLVAIELVPGLVDRLRERSREAAARDPGAWRAPRRAFTTLVAAVAHAAALADRAAAAIEGGEEEMR